MKKTLVAIIIALSAWVSGCASQKWTKVSPGVSFGKVSVQQVCQRDRESERFYFDSIGRQDAIHFHQFNVIKIPRPRNIFIYVNANGLYPGINNAGFLAYSNDNDNHPDVVYVTEKIKGLDPDCPEGKYLPEQRAKEEYSDRNQDGKPDCVIPTEVYETFYKKSLRARHSPVAGFSIAAITTEIGSQEDLRLQAICSDPCEEEEYRKLNPDNCDIPGRPIEESKHRKLRR